MKDNVKEKAKSLGFQKSEISSILAVIFSKQIRDIIEKGLVDSLTLEEFDAKKEKIQTK